jgi:hypothetical protein
MDRYWKTDAAADAPIVPDSNGGGYPADGKPENGIAGTVPGAWWFHSITEELRNAIVQLGGVPDWRKVDQLGSSISDAVAAVIREAAANLVAPDGASLVGFIQRGPNAITRTAQDKMRDALSTHDFPTVQDAVNEAIASGRTLVIEAGTAVPQLAIAGRIDIVARGTVKCDYDGTKGAWVHVASGCDESSLVFDTIDFAGHGVMGILLDAPRCTVKVRLAKNMTAQAYAIANRQCVVVSQASDNDMDVTACDFSMGDTGGANAVPRVITTDGGSTRNRVRIRATHCHTVWVDNGVTNSAESIIADSCTDNGIYNLPGSKGMTCAYLQYTNSHEEAYVLEGVNAFIAKVVQDGWAYPGLQNCTNAEIGEIVVLPAPDGSTSNVVLYSRTANIRSDIRIGRITGTIDVGNLSTTAAILHFYAGTVDVSVGVIDLLVRFRAASQATALVIHTAGARAEYGAIRLRLDDTEAKPPARLAWRYPAGAKLRVGKWDVDPRDYAWVGISGMDDAVNTIMPVGQELLGSVMQNPGSTAPLARIVFGTVAPATGTADRGDTVLNKLSFTGGAAAWKCTASGSPGTWRVMGQAGIGRGLTRPNAQTMGVASDADWAGTWFLDTALAAAGKPIVWTGAAWVDATGATV